MSHSVWNFYVTAVVLSTFCFLLVSNIGIIFPILRPYIRCKQATFVLALVLFYLI